MSDEQNVQAVSNSGNLVNIPADILQQAGGSADMKFVNDLGGKTDAFGKPIGSDNPIEPKESVTAEPTADSDIQKFVAEALGQAPTITPESVAKEGDTNVVATEPNKVEASVKAPYTANEMASLDVDAIDTSRIPNELLPFYKAMLRPVTKKSQEYSEKNRELERQLNELNAKLDAQKRYEYQQRMAQEESQLTPEELADKRKQQEIAGLREEVQAIRSEREQQRLTAAIESEYSANARELGIPDDVKDDALTLVWKQWQLDNANGRPRAAMRDILEANKGKLDRLAGNVTPSKIDLNTLETLLKANPETGKAYVMKIINAYVQSKKQGANVITANPTTPIPSQPEGEKQFKSYAEWQENRDKLLANYAR
jgi:hypothetical protein